MNTFRTIIPPTNFSFKIAHKNRIMCLGSCFAENIGRFIANAKFSSLINPFGIIYNPMSICKALDMIIQNVAINKSDLITINDRYHHWDFHGDLSGIDQDRTSALLTSTINNAHKFIQDADILFITLGTANAFRLKQKNQIVANCHKYPNKNFNRIALQADEMVTQFQKTIETLKLINPGLNIVFTVSPVRHLRDGLANNQLSKAKLLLTAHHLCKTNQDVHYFPSYELVVDDLRDYRFYTSDMLHVNETGLAYIWQYFKESFFSDQTINLIDKINKINKDIAHKAFYPDSDQHQKFLKTLLSKFKELETEDSLINFSEEKIMIKEQIKN